MEVTLPRFLFVREARYYFNNLRKVTEGRGNAPHTAQCGTISLAKNPGIACPVNLPENGVGDRICTRNISGLS